jgi:hypothetical protein
VAVTLADMKDHLNIRSSSDDFELLGFLAAGLSVVEGLVGSITPTSYTESHSGGSVSIILYHQPVISIDSVTEWWGNGLFTLSSQPLGGGVSDQYGYTLDDASSGRLTRRMTGGYPFPFIGGTNSITVTYTAGRTSVPASIDLAQKIITASLWTSQRGTAALPPMGGDMQAVPVGGGGQIPSLALQLIEGSGLMRVPGIG